MGARPLILGGGGTARGAIASLATATRAFPVQLGPGGQRDSKAADEAARRLRHATGKARHPSSPGPGRTRLKDKFFLVLPEVIDHVQVEGSPGTGRVGGRRPAGDSEQR